MKVCDTFRKKASRDGFTLLEILIAIALLSIILLAGFQAIQFAYISMTSSEEFVEDSYVLQQQMENDLSMVGVEEIVQDVVTLANASSGALSAAQEEIDFNWNGSPANLRDFRTYGVTIEREASGGSYIDRTIYIYVPVINGDQIP